MVDRAAATEKSYGLSTPSRLHHNSNLRERQISTCAACLYLFQEAEERHRQALWADQDTKGTSFVEEDEKDEEEGVIGNDDQTGHPAWRLALKRFVNQTKFQVCEQQPGVIRHPE